jgi:glycine betaine/proline transport system permease protein
MTTLALKAPPTRVASIWPLLAAAAVLGPLVAAAVPWLDAYPQGLVLPVTTWLNQFMAWFVALVGPLFRAVSWLLGWPISWVQSVLHWMPWPLTIALAAVVAHKASGWKLALFTTLGMLYMVVVGYWPESMNTLSLVAISVPLSVAVGFLIGVAAFRWPKCERVVTPTLDFLQTVPTFAYLLPVLLLFGFGPVTGLVTSLLYAFPAMVRNTVLGLRRVPQEVLESGLMSGATPRQLFWLVQVPSAQRQILLGVNQTVMAALSMVVIASIIGGTQDIGWEVLSTMRKAAFGESLLAGVVIVIMAMLLDRISRGLATGGTGAAPHGAGVVARHGHVLLAVALVPVLLGLAQLWPLLKVYPDDLTVYPAAPINDLIGWLVVNLKSWIELIKRFAFYFAMLPIRIGLEATVKPASWGFAWSAWHSLGYAVVMGGAAVWAARALSTNAAIAVVIWSAVYFFGITNMPWLLIVALVTALAWSAGGKRLAVGTFLGLLFLLVAGIWEDAVLSIYLCGLAVLISFLIGSLLGIWAAHSNTVSRVMQPVNDTLQTIPLFVLLIPIVMIFKVGEFTALLAICLYAVVPAARYAEHALRQLPDEVIEAATAMGCTPRQLLFQVKLPLALPELMLGLNQTIMYGIAMLVITALVGTKELGQRVYIGLSDGDFGVGMVAGLGMAVIAIIADRLTQGWSARKRSELRLR